MFLWFLLVVELVVIFLCLNDSLILGVYLDQLESGITCYMLVSHLRKEKDSFQRDTEVYPKCFKLVRWTKHESRIIRRTVMWLGDLLISSNNLIS